MRSIGCSLLTVCALWVVALAVPATEYLRHVEPVEQHFQLPDAAVDLLEHVSPKRSSSDPESEPQTRASGGQQDERRYGESARGDGQHAGGEPE